MTLHDNPIGPCACGAWHKLEERIVPLEPADRAALYKRAFPKRVGLLFDEGWVVGTWTIGACYKNPNPLYGAYPHGYLERVHAMFPDALHVLHVFSGGLTAEHAWEWTDAATMELVDLHGPEQGRYPTWQGDVCAMPEAWAGRFDLGLADPPYSPKDAEKYDVKMPNRAEVMRALARVTKPGGNLVWLDQAWPMHRKDQWRTWAHIGLVRSTNHRPRLVSMFERVAA